MCTMNTNTQTASAWHSGHFQRSYKDLEGEHVVLFPIYSQWCSNEKHLSLPNETRNTFYMANCSLF